MKRLSLTLLFGAAAAGVACSATPNLLPVNDLNRPQDVTFMCFGAYGPTDGALTVSGRPMRACHPQDVYDPAAAVTSRTFAFMPQSGSGGLTVVDADHWKLVDLAAQTGGYGQAPLGSLPSQVSASDDGCRLLTANRGSCDLSLVDPSVLVAPTFALASPTNLPSPRTATMTIRPLKSDGTFLTAAPYEAVFLPQDTSKLVNDDPTQDATAPGPLCGADGAAAAPLGWPAASGPVPWYALVTYPSCDLVAVVALPTGQIVSSAHVKQTTGPGGTATVALVDAGTAPSCPVDCAGQAVAPATTRDAGTAIGAPVAAAADAAPAAADGATAAPADAATAADAAADAGMSGAAGQPGTGTAGAGAGGQGGLAGATGNQYPDPPYVSKTRAIGPSGIAILPDGTRAYIGLANASYVLSVGLSSAGLGLPGNPVYLHEGARGALRVRLNVDPYRYLSNPGQAGVFVGAETGASSENSDALSHGMTLPDVGQRKYLYVIAQDGTVRVVSVFLPGAETECETNIDPMNLPAGVSAGTACTPVDPGHRRPFSVGPGIHVPGLPVDVAAADVRIEPTEDHGEQSVNGAHAWVLTDLGAVYLVNINPVLRKYAAALPRNNFTFSPAAPDIDEPEPFVNTLRDRNQITYAVTLDPSSGPPRVDVLPSTPSTGPYIEPFWTQGGEWNPTALTNLFVQTGVFFPREPNRLDADDPIDRRAVTPQEWTVTWQGALGGGHSTGVLYGTGQAPFPADPKRRQPMGADAMLRDNGANYCGQGVTAGDLVTLTGCTQNNQCGLGEICLLDETVSSASAGLPINGLCADPNRTDATAANCAAFLQTIRRYEIAAAYPNQLVIRPHLDELARSSLHPCDPAKNAPANGAMAAAPAPDGGALEDTSPDVCPDPNDPSTDNFRCLADPEGATTPRCLVQCNSKTSCRAGRICVDLNSDKLPTPAECDKKSCFCADAPPFTPSAKLNCFDQLTSYQIQVGNGFLVAGSQSGFMATARLPGSGDEQCAPDPAGDPRFTFRIPMNAPACTSLPAGVTQFDTRIDPDSHTSDSPEYQAAVAANLQLVNALTTPPAPADPCLFWGGPVQGDSLAYTTLPQHVRALFRNAQLTFVLANLDRGPTAQFSTAFDVHGGFAPQAVQDPATVEVSMPARIVYGPIDAMAQMTPFTPALTEERYLFVVDQRRLGRSQGGAPTRGQLLRIHPLGYSTTVGSAPTGSQPIFQDYNASGGLFPIQ